MALCQNMSCAATDEEGLLQQSVIDLGQGAPQHLRHAGTEGGSWQVAVHQAAS